MADVLDISGSGEVLSTVDSTILTEQEEEIVTEEDNFDDGDAFIDHLESEIAPEFLDVLTKKDVEIFQKNWPFLKNIQYHKPRYKLKEPNKFMNVFENSEAKNAAPKDLSSMYEDFSLEKCFVKPKILNNVEAANKRFNSGPLSELQKEILLILSTYRDFYYPNETFDNLEELRFVYCLHAINHCLKTRLKVIRNNEKKDSANIRDQGIVRPKVLILAPFRESALRMVKIISSLLLGESKDVANKKRFYEEFSGQTLSMPVRNPKPEDYEKTFQGNTHDNFSVGIAITKKSIKLYADYYASSIIIGSPLAIRMIIGAEGEKTRNYDFLASIEMLILDQTHIISMQNWEHVLDVVNHLHLVPKESHGTDLTRVRMWALNGLTKYYMQTIVFSSHMIPEINALVKSRFNYEGLVLVTNPVIIGSIAQVVLPVPQVFQNISASSLADAAEKKFQEFSSKFLNQYRESQLNNVFIFVPSYFDFVRIRNYFKRQDIGFVQICEYTKDSKVSRARDLFFHREVRFMLYTERVHFYRRLKIKGIKHILFYGLPTFPHLYSEIINFLQMKSNRNDTEDTSVTVMYTKYDIVQLANIVGTDRAARMIASSQPVHILMSGD